MSTRVKVSIDTIVELYNKGKSTIEIGKIIGVSYSTINKLLKKEGVKLRERGGHKKELPIDTIVELYNKGKSTIEIGEMFSVSGITINNRLKKVGVCLRKPGGCNKKDLPIEHVWDMYKKNESVESIAGTFGVARSTILRRLKENGFKTKPEGRDLRKCVIDTIKELHKKGYSIDEICGLTKFCRDNIEFHIDCN